MNNPNEHSERKNLSELMNSVKNNRFGITDKAKIESVIRSLYDVRIEEYDNKQLRHDSLPWRWSRLRNSKIYR
jgi:hypothetical protein